MDHLNITNALFPSGEEHFMLLSSPLNSHGASIIPPLPTSGYSSMAANALSIFLLAILSRATYILFARSWLSTSRHLPSPNQGCVLFRLLHEPKVTELEQWMDTIPNTGLIRYYGLWNEERLYAASPAAVTDLLVKQPYHYTKPRLQYVLADNIASKGLLIQEGDIHKKARKAFNPAFNAERIRKAYPAMLRSAADTVDHVSAQIQQGDVLKPTGQVSILKLISAAAIDIIGHWGFSRSFNALEDKKGFGKAYLAMFKTTVRGQKTLDAAAKIGPELALSLPLRAVQTIKSVMQLVRQTSEDIVIEHENETSPQDDMLAMIMKTGHFTHTELVDQTVHFLAAATETVSGSIAWAIHLLSRHPEMQDRLRAEIHMAFPSQASLVKDDSASVLEHMPYLNAVIKEVLRFHSINTILWRESVSDVSAICGHRIPRGTKVTFSPWALNRDPSLWGPDARLFNPDRWMHDPVSGGADRNYAFLTFGAGPRRCIGETYAKAEMRCMLVSLFGAFDWAPIEELKGDNGSDFGEEIGDNHALTLFKILEGWKVKCTMVAGWA
ncbi:Putative cytochrome P450 [Septoria linicola]|uniref:Cytochrome P450 n=1 Tax=Septoria linicola TaxID=215465 RepID=A0A9Q9EMX0_9PEZI|nr:Putative cytochrome P450 [Septoria linicola]